MEDSRALPRDDTAVGHHGSDEPPAAPPPWGFVRLLAATYLYALGWLVVASVGVAALTGWRPVAIASGSMAPLIREGDVVLSDTGLRPPAPGDVVTFARPGLSGTVTHRVVGLTSDGRLVTKGDANAVVDSTPVPGQAVAGVGRLLVPSIALPVVWATTDRWVQLVGFVVLTVGAGWLATRPPPTRVARRRRRRIGGPGPVVAGVTIAVLVGAGVALLPGSVAAFSAATDSAGNQIEALDGWNAIVDIAAGESHTCIVKARGSAWCWGRNDKGQLGDATSTDRSSAGQVVGPGGAGLLGKAERISAGTKHTCAGRDDGSAWCWGLNNEGQLGDGTKTDRQTPVQVVGAGGTGVLEAVVDLGAGAQHTCAADDSGAAHCWGRNDKGQLGDGTKTDRQTPVQVVGAGGSGTLDDVDRVAAGVKHACAVRADTSAWCWGHNNEGQLGDGSTGDSTWPVQVVGVGGVGKLSGVSDVAGGESHTCALKTDGSVWCWGRNDKGQLGDGTGTDSDTPVQVVGPGSGSLAGIVALDASIKHTCAIDDGGSAWCWGLNNEGQLGDGTSTDRDEPVQVVGLGGTGTLDLGILPAAGKSHGCAARSDETVWCWGRNDKGQLGDGTTNDSLVPVLVAL